VPTIPRVLVVSGSLRSRSTNSAIACTVGDLAPTVGMQVDRYGGMGTLPHFNPDDDRDPLHAAVVDLRRRIEVATALIFSVPEYAGALPGSFKNLLDWTIGDDRVGSIYGKPVGWINASPRGAADAHQELRRVLTYAHAHIVEAACVDAPVTGAMVGGDGLIADPGVRGRIAGALASLIQGAPDGG
jgi:chromate reductase, NAD(P)H dehydrogenase (quinone)